MKLKLYINNVFIGRVVTFLLLLVFTFSCSTTNIEDETTGDITEHEISSEDVEVLNDTIASQPLIATITKQNEISIVPPPIYAEELNTEEYLNLEENIFLSPIQNPLSTFSADVDTASYSNVRRYLNNSNQLPPKEVVRIEEMVNYFNYDYPTTKSDNPFSTYIEYSSAPWNMEHNLLLIALQTESIAFEDLPPYSITFLLDISGSMNNPNKLPLLKKSVKLLVDNMRAEDKISIVTYASGTGVVADGLTGEDKATILEAIDSLSARGTTAGASGINLAYEVAEENKTETGINRIILATDGDFNIGVSSEVALQELIEQKRESGIYLSVLGFGMGNYKDNKVVTLANNGNGNYAYIDNLLEAKKVLVNEVGQTLNTVAKDVKLQIEFNPSQVGAYRLIGYEKRILRAEDFNDDETDAGEIGAGHSVTALYEIIPPNSSTLKDYVKSVDTLRYQSNNANETSSEIFNLKIRYKAPELDADNDSTLVENSYTPEKLNIEKTSDDFRFVASVASFSMILKDSTFKGNATYEDVFNLARDALGEDQEGYRSEYISLVKKAEQISEL